MSEEQPGAKRAKLGAPAAAASAGGAAAAAAAPLAAAAATSECPQLLEWVRAAGGLVGNVELRSEVGLGRGVYATQDLKAGEVLFRLQDSIITTETALASGLGAFLATRCKIVKACSEEQQQVEAAAGEAEASADAPGGEAVPSGGGAAAAADDREELTERSVLYAFLLQARHCAAITIDMSADEKDYGPYARSLPAAFSTPFSWRRELGLLPAPLEDLDHDGVDLVSELGSLGQHLQTQFAVLKGALAGSKAGLAQSGKLTVREWLWAHQAYSSRCFRTAARWA